MKKISDTFDLMLSRRDLVQQCIYFMPHIAFGQNTA
jgi:hypothetical protein